MSTRTPSPVHTVPPDLARPTAEPGSLRAGRGAVVARVAAGWWAAAAVTALVVVLTGRSLPVGDGVRYPDGVLRQVDAGSLSVWVAALAVVGALVALAARRAPGAPTGRGARVAVLAGGGVALAGVLSLTGMTVLARLGYLPITLLLAPFDDEFRFVLLHQFVTAASTLEFVALVGAVLLATSLVRFRRLAVDACASCGRRDDGDDPAWTTPVSAARWGRVATWAAAAAPAIYAATRLAWAAGLPLGFSRESLEKLHDSAGWLAALGLGGFALAGSVLTLGLTSRWGEVFPRWVPRLAGRSVPVPLAVVPPTVVAVAALPAGLAIIADVLSGMTLATDDGGSGLLAAVGPTFLWPLWSVALGAAAYAYWLRRRGTCRACGRG